MYYLSTIHIEVSLDRLPVCYEPVPAGYIEVSTSKVSMPMITTVLGL